MWKLLTHVHDSNFETTGINDGLVAKPMYQNMATECLEVVLSKRTLYRQE